MLSTIRNLAALLLLTAACSSPPGRVAQPDAVAADAGPDAPASDAATNLAAAAQVIPHYCKWRAFCGGESVENCTASLQLAAKDEVDAGPSSCDIPACVQALDYNFEGCQDAGVLPPACAGCLVTWDGL